MDRPVIFLQFLLVLMVAINALSACKCGKMNTIKDAVCNGQTLVMASAESKGPADKFGRPVTNEDEGFLTVYSMFLNVMYNEGHNKMGEKVNFDLITANTADACGVDLELNTDYFIAGTAMNGTQLLVHSCDYVERVPWNEKSAEEIEQMNDLLTSQTQVDCRNSCRIITPLGVILKC
ncbi:hypothetical protein ACJMK2_038760 [Sinanodonta woodiana]|uniref:NTR domain-containing protein n=1 Tax=Sinanodonta woodiana TaxID=1069815 RepID=A0ABD3WBE2_SINWO